MELASNLQGEQLPQLQDESDELLSNAFRKWAEAMSATQIRYLLTNCSADGLAEYTRQNNLQAHDSRRIWSLLKAELVTRLQALTAPADPHEIAFVRQWADALTPEESATILVCGSPEAFNAHLQARQMPALPDLHRMWALFEIELRARTGNLTSLRGNVGTA